MSGRAEEDPGAADRPDSASVGRRREALGGLALLERLPEDHPPRNPREGRDPELARAQVGLVRDLIGAGALLGPGGPGKGRPVAYPGEACRAPRGDTMGPAAVFRL